MSEETANAGIALDIGPRHALGAVIGAVVVALYASWMVADLAGRWLTFPLVAIIAGYFLLQRTDAGDKIVFVGYAIAGLLAVTPLAFIIPDVIADYDGGSLSTFVFGTANVLLVVVFVIPAVIVAYATYRFDGGSGIVQRILDR